MGHKTRRYRKGRANDLAREADFQAAKETVAFFERIHPLQNTGGLGVQFRKEFMEEKARRAQAINSAKGLMSKPFDQAQADKQSASKKRRPINLRGLFNYKAGRVHYARDGYRWLFGKYVKENPRATGLTHSYSISRADERAQQSQRDHPPRRRSARSKAKAAGYERFLRNKAILAERQRMLDADRRAQRAARGGMYRG